RQIDVLIENEELGTRVVVDCKDWAKRVSAPDAHAFAGLLEDVEATGGVLICNRGFSKATASLAKAKGFTLARLHDVGSRKGAPGHIAKNVAVSINYRVAASSKLGYVSPREARGIFDEETQSFSTVHFNVGETVKQEPEGGWQEIHEPRELAIRYAGTVVTMD